MVRSASADLTALTDWFRLQRVSHASRDLRSPLAACSYRQPCHMRLPRRCGNRYLPSAARSEATLVVYVCDDIACSRWSKPHDHRQAG